MFLSFQESFCFAHLTEKNKKPCVNYVMRRRQCVSYAMQGIPTWHLVSSCNSSVSQLKQFRFRKQTTRSGSEAKRIIIIFTSKGTPFCWYMQKIWGWLYLEKCPFDQVSLPTKKHACIRESWETFHWYLTNLEFLLCDLCVIYTWIFENQVSKKISLFYDLAI